MVSSLLLSLLCLFLLVFTNYILQRHLRMKNMLALSSCYVKQESAYSGVHCYCRSQKGQSDSTTSFDCYICLYLFSKGAYIPFKVCITLWSSVVQVTWQTFEENNVLFPCTTNLFLKKAAMYCLWESVFVLLSLKIGTRLASVEYVSEAALSKQSHDLIALNYCLYLFSSHSHTYSLLHAKQI